MSTGRLAVLILASMVALGGLLSAFASVGDSNQAASPDAIQVRKDDAGDDELVDSDDGDGDLTFGDDGTRGGDNTGDGDSTRGNDGTRGGDNTGDGDSTRGNDGTDGGDNSYVAPAPAPSYGYGYGDGSDDGGT